jgi:hypothetical protein
MVKLSSREMSLPYLILATREQLLTKDFKQNGAKVY